jgi:hypothetical protein
MSYRIRLSAISSTHPGHVSVELSELVVLYGIAIAADPARARDGQWI